MSFVNGCGYTRVPTGCSLRNRVHAALEASKRAEPSDGVRPDRLDGLGPVVPRCPVANVAIDATVENGPGEFVAHGSRSPTWVQVPRPASPRACRGPGPGQAPPAALRLRSPLRPG